MAEALKHMYSRNYISRVATAIKAQYPVFDGKGFEQWVQNNDWPEMPLKTRMRHICHGLKTFIDRPYEDSLNILKPASMQFGGGELGDYASMFFPDYVEQYGLDHFDASIVALEHFTQYSSAEFAVRPFIKQHGDKMMPQMLAWCDSPNYYVRRLASEGCRPRLPWAMALPAFKQDPSPILPILDKLKADSHLFVRRSVANNLNDIAKDHPQIVLDCATQWQGQSSDIDWLIKHATRTLLKQAHPSALALFGFTPPDHVHLSEFHVDQDVRLGEALHFSCLLSSTSQNLGKLRIEYAVDFMKANGQLKAKVFQISEAGISKTRKQINKTYSFKPISTRRYYVGQHQIHIIINGRILATKPFTLLNATPK